MLNENYTPNLRKLFVYAKSADYCGHDLFDGLNSRLFKNSFLYKNEYFRLALIQFCKLSPVNFRNLLFVPKGFNPKGGALFLLGMLELYRYTGEELYLTEAKKLYDKLINTIIKWDNGCAFGYNFDWQARAFYVPVGTPNTVTSVYAGHALLTYHEILKDDSALQNAINISDFILNEMIKFENEDFACFNYIPNKDAEVHNASLLAAAYLARVNTYLNDPQISQLISKAAAFSIADINWDGSWPYGTKPFHRWVDNFHTAFNIECLMDIQQYTETNLESTINRVTDYYFKNLFTSDGTPKYYNNRLYPVDVHVLAEVLVLLARMNNKNLHHPEIDRIRQAVCKLVQEFQAENGSFYHQKTKYYTNKIPYIRWGQAWMFYGLSKFISSYKI